MDVTALKELEDRKIAEEKAQNAGFMAWHDSPLARMGLGLAAKGDHDATRLLLRSAFDAGWNAGASCVVGSLIEGLLKKKGGGRSD